MGSEVIMVTVDDDVYAMGCNSSGCLGLGDTASALQPRKIESLCKKKIKGLNHLSLFFPFHFCCCYILILLLVTFKTHIGLAYGSGLHLLAFSDSGELYTWGYNTYSQLGNGNTNHTLTPSLVSGVLAGKTVIQVNIYSITKFVLLLIINPF
jgi:RCC1 and BTB domain-containing protein